MPDFQAVKTLVMPDFKARQFQQSLVMPGFSGKQSPSEFNRARLFRQKSDKAKA